MIFNKCDDGSNFHIRLILNSEYKIKGWPAPKPPLDPTSLVV